MRTSFFILLKQSMIYGAGQLLVRIVSFLFLPIMTNPKYLPLTEYGLWNILNATLTILITILTFGMNTALFKFYYLSENSNFQKRVSNTILIFLIFMSIILFIICSNLVFPAIGKYIDSDSNISYYLSWIMIIAILYVIGIVPQNILRAEEKPLRYIVFQIIRFLFLLLFIIILLMKYQYQLWGIILSYIIAYSITLILLLIDYSAELSFDVDLKLLKNILKFSLPLVPLQLGGWILSVSDRYIIGLTLDMDSVALYSVGYQIGMLVNIFIIMPFSIAWGPFLFKVYKEKNAKYIYAKTLEYITFISLWVALIISIFSRELLSLLTNNPEFGKSRLIIPFVAFGYVFYGMYFVFTTGLNIKKKTYYFPFIIILTGFFNISVNFLAIPYVGMYAPAVNTLISYMLLAYLTYLFSNRYYSIKFNVKIIILMFIFVLPLSVSGFYLSIKNPIFNYILKVVIIILPLILAYLIGLFGSSSLKSVKEIIYRTKWK